MITNKFTHLEEKPKPNENLETREAEDADISDDEEICEKL
jgi:hypothetical protein